MSNYAISLKRTTLLLAALAFTAALLVVNLSVFSGKASAGQFTARSLTTSSTLSGAVGSTTAANSETNGADTTHTFAFDNSTAGTVLSMQFDYCTTAIGTCTTPDVNLEVETGTAITVQTHETVTLAVPFTIDATSDANTLRITRSGAAWGTGTSGNIVIAFDDIHNPHTEAPYFVRITSYSAVNWTSQVDEGTVANAVTDGVSITSKVAETLGFSVTGNAFTGIINPTSACLALTGTGAMLIGDPTENTLAINLAYDNYSAFRVYTNAGTGVVITYEGETLTKGSDSIDEINAGSGAATTSTTGDEQFGLAADLVNGGDSTVNIESSNTDADLQYANTAAQLALNGPLSIVAAYNDGEGSITTAGTANFAFNGGSPVTIASSSSYVDCKTVAIRYIANIDPLTPAGTYTTTIVYQAVPTY